MKVTAEHLANLTEAIAPLDTPERRTAYRSGNFAKADRVKDLDKRYRWDLFWAAWDAAGQSPEFLAQYNDAHLDTALRHIVPVLGEEPARTTQEVQDAVTAEAIEAIKNFDLDEVDSPSVAVQFLTQEVLTDIAARNIDQAVGITLADGRSFSTKILGVIERNTTHLLVKGWAYESGDYNPFAVVKYPLAQVADFAPFGADQFVAV